MSDEEGEVRSDATQALINILSQTSFQEDDALLAAIKRYADPAPSGQSTREQLDTVHKWSGPSVGSLNGDAQERIETAIKAARNIYPSHDTANHSKAYNDTMVRLTVAQAIQESGSHLDSGLAKSYNFFGIKGPGSKGTKSFQTHEEVNGTTITINADFAVNETPEDSFLQHQALLDKQRYKGVRDAAEKGDFNGAANAIHQAGYATDSYYAEHLTDINNSIVSPLLAKVDAEAAQKLTATTNATVPQSASPQPYHRDVAVQNSAGAAKALAEATSIENAPKPSGVKTEEEKLKLAQTAAIKPTKLPVLGASRG